jgi:hypothetical protein
MDTSVDYKRIKIALRPMTKEEFAGLDQWENEGGSPPSEDAMSLLQSPIKPGESFKIVKGSIIHENGYCFFVADIEIID